MDLPPPVLHFILSMDSTRAILMNRLNQDRYLWSHKGNREFFVRQPSILSALSGVPRHIHHVCIATDPPIKYIVFGNYLLIA